jgi:hypothetical protein
LVDHVRGERPIVILQGVEIGLIEKEGQFLNRTIVWLVVEISGVSARSDTRTENLYVGPNVGDHVVVIGR